MLLFFNKKSYLYPLTKMTEISNKVIPMITPKDKNYLHKLYKIIKINIKGKQLYNLLMLI